MKTFYGVLICGLAVCGVAQAQQTQQANSDAGASVQCKLQMVTSLDMTPAADGILVPVSINGAIQNFKLDLAVSPSYLGQEAADALKLSLTPLRRPVVMNGYQIKQSAVVNKFAIGPMAASDQTIPVLPKDAMKEGEAGILGSGVLSDVDFELDFGNHKLNIFSPNHCPGRVVYWTTSPAAEIPFEVDAAGHLVIAAQLNDESVSVGIGTGPDSLLSLAVAHDQLGLDASSPDMIPATQVAVPTGVPASQVFDYRFKSLSMSGVTVNNPQLVVYGTDRQSACSTRLKDPIERCAGQPDVNLGLAQLSKFHIYVSSKEKIIYLTAASTH